MRTENTNENQNFATFRGHINTAYLQHHPVHSVVKARFYQSQINIFFHPQPSPVKKERSPRPQSFCHSSSVSPQEKLPLPGYLGHRDKQRLSYGAFANPVYSTSTDTPASPVSEGPTIASKTTSKGKHTFKINMHDTADKKESRTGAWKGNACWQIDLFACT